MAYADATTSALVGIAPGPGLLFGLILLTAIIGGHLAHSIRVPRVIGLLLSGIALRFAVYEIFASGNGDAGRQTLEAASEALRPVKDLALGLILFTIGAVFERSRIRSGASRIIRISSLEIGLCLLVVFIGCLTAAWITQPKYGLGDNILLAVLLAIAATATAPAATLFVLQEYESKGPITETILGLTGANNVVCIILFYSTFLVLAWFGAIVAPPSLSEHIWPALAVTTVGSFVLGMVFGMLISIVHSKLPLAETLLVFFAVFLLLGAGEKWLLTNVGLSFNFLLTTLVIGAIFANVAIDSQKLSTALQTLGGPIYAAFFVMAGYGLHVDELAAMGWIGGAYIICRVLGKTLGCQFGVRWARGPERADSSLGRALVCQAAVVIGLASFVDDNWESELARQFSTVVLGSVAIFELTGPLLIKRCVVQGGEVKAITLLRRAGPTPQTASILKLTLQSFIRLFRRYSASRPANAQDMTVGHIMRTNVQLIPAVASLDDVLHFIERSTYSHFPVVHEGGQLAGVIHFSDVRDVIYDPMLRELVTAVDLADPESATVPIDMTLTELLDVFTHQNVAVLPVVEQSAPKRIVGVVEQRDLLRTLHMSQDAE